MLTKLSVLADHTSTCHMWWLAEEKSEITAVDRPGCLKPSKQPRSRGRTISSGPQQSKFSTERGSAALAGRCPQHSRGHRVTEGAGESSAEWGTPFSETPSWRAIRRQAGMCHCHRTCHPWSTQGKEGFREAEQTLR